MEIILNGNAGKNACSGMKGGSVHILGNADDGFCSLPTSMNEGLVDGFIYVQKNVGDNSIVRMRKNINRWKHWVRFLSRANIRFCSCLEKVW